MKPEDIKDLFDLEESLWWFRGMRRIADSLLTRETDLSCINNILDVGCGAGGNLRFLEHYTDNGKVWGMDVSRDALRFCALDNSGTLVQASALQLPFLSDHFDLVTSFDVLVQLPGDDADASALREMHRVTRPGGYVFLRAAAYEWMRAGHDRVMNTQRRYQAGDLRKKLEQAGFEVVRSTYANMIPFPAAILKRLVLERLHLAARTSDVRRFSKGLSLLDPLFRNALIAESYLLRHSRVSLPFGLSVICIAKKPIAPVS
ncbi:MAG: methyltransferase domain-containing protein [Acidobacteria bacterium]|nr:methyltransferase domain-containing protein [Acidobacteriota bacterium]